MLFDYDVPDKRIRCRVDFGRDSIARIVIHYPKTPEYFQLLMDALSNFLAEKSGEMVLGSNTLLDQDGSEVPCARA